MLIFLVFCEKDEDITGDSYLRIINNCDYGVRIYFDDADIGRVNSEENETWSVPSGTHTIKATCSFSEDYEASHSFNAG